MATSERFIDLLDVVEDQDDAIQDKTSLYIREGAAKLPQTINSREHTLGPLSWNTQLSVELQRACDTFNNDALCELDFSVTVADPTLPDCPLVACSIGFTTLTGYTVHEIVGRNCRFMLNGVPPELCDDEVRFMCRSFCQSVKQGKEYDGRSEVLPAGVSKCWFSLPQGELVCIQTNASKSGELFRNMFYLKQVELDDTAYILALQAGIPDECEDMSALNILQTKCHATWQKLDENMATIEQALTSQFWYHAPMRRQDNCKPLDQILKI
jgi:hypothetical protein